MDNETFAVTWRCPVCRHENKKQFVKIDWSLTRGRCGDIEGVYLYDKCTECGQEEYSVTNPE